MVFLNKPRTDPTVGPLDIAKSYVDSVFNDTTVNVNKLIGAADLSGGTSTSILNLPLFQPGTSGAQTRPNEGGFAFADAPECTVFVVKKQWIEGEWTYVATALERAGKVEELTTRLRISNIITRKLEWLNNHELFTKFSDLTSGLQVGTNNELGGSLQKGSKGQEGLSGSQVTRYYTERLTLQSEEIVQEKTTSQEVSVAAQVVVNTSDEGAAGRLLIRKTADYSAPVLSALHGPHTGGPSTNVVKTTGIGSNTGRPQNVINGLNSIDNGKTVPFPTLIDADGTFDASKAKAKSAAEKFVTQGTQTLEGAQFWEIDLTSLTSEQLFVSTPGVTAPHPGEYQGSPTEVLNKLKADKIGYIARTPKGRSPPKQLALATGTPIAINVSISTTTIKKGPVQTFDNTFNGVIELTNVSQVSTSLSNTGSIGTATISIQNPNNILTVSEDDILIAMGNDPFLDNLPPDQFGQPQQDLVTTDPVTKTQLHLKYYRGKYYTDRAYALVTKQDFSAIGNFTNTAEINGLQTVLGIMQDDLRNLQDFLSNGQLNSGSGASLLRTSADYSKLAKSSNYTGPTAPLFGTGTDIEKISVSPNGPSISELEEGGFINTVSGAFKVYAVRTKRKMLALTNAIQNVQEKISSLQQATIGAGENVTTTDAKALRNIRWRQSQLQKYFQNRTIFEVYDRVYIWMSSPSRTAHTLADGTPVAEDLQQSGILVRRIQDIISLMKQLSGVISAIAVALKQPIVNPLQLSNTIDSINNDLVNNDGIPDAWLDIKDQVKQAFPTVSAAPAIAILVKTIDQKLKELVVYKKSAKKNPGKLPTSTDTIVQGIDPKNLFGGANTFGLTETQFQVFQGVITGIKRSFSEGSYTIELNCEDNLNFLQRSRFIEIPAMGQYAIKTAPFLDDPLWRTKDVGLTGKISTDLKPDSLVGRWKTGVWTFQATLSQGKDTKAQSKEESQTSQPTTPSDAITEDIASRALGRPAFSQVENELFKGADPAQIVSVLVTGTPFNVAKYLENTLFKGSVIANPQPKDSKTPHSGEEIQIGPFESVRRSILEQTKKFGGFEPYLAQEVSVQQNLKEQITQISFINLGRMLMTFAKVYAVTREQIGLKAAVATITSEELIDKSPWRSITPDNVGKIFASVSQIPDAAKSIKLGTAFATIGPEVQFALLAAMSQAAPPAQFNNLFANAFVANKFDAIAQGFAAGFESNANRSALALTADETALYTQITQQTQQFVNAGPVFKYLGDNSQLIPKDLSDPTVSAAEVKAQKEARDALFADNPLQATKGSIIFRKKPNFFVVSSQYLLTPNLVDYTQKMRDNASSMGENTYTTVIERCRKAAETIGYEFYADSQGHIRFKPPTYNRVLLRHFLDVTNVEQTYVLGLKEFLKQYNMQDALLGLVYQAFLVEVNKTKITAMSNIRLALAQAANIVLPASLFGTGDLFGSSTLGFLFGSPSPTTILAKMLADKRITPKRLVEIRAFLQAPPDAVQILLPNKSNLDSVDEFTSLVPGFANLVELLAPAKLLPKLKEDFADLFDPASKFDFTNNPPPTIAALRTAISAVASTKELDFDTTIQSLKGEMDQIKIDNDLNTPSTEIKNTQTKTLQERIDDVEGALTVFLERNIALAKACSDSRDKTSTLLASLQSKIDPVVQYFTDEQYVHNISSAIIISEQYDESAPEFTRLNVATAFPYNTSGEPIQKKFLNWVGSVDFDLWRIYGYKPTSVDTPFFTTGTAAVPYADLLMARQYSTILKATLSVRGDSKYQMGDCVFIEDENIYYYISGVSHNFTYGSGYTTTLILTYGRRPGYYIPYPFDALGQKFVRGGNAMFQTGVSDFSTILKSQEEADAKAAKEGQPQ